VEVTTRIHTLYVSIIFLLLIPSRKNMMRPTKPSWLGMHCCPTGVAHSLEEESQQDLTCDCEKFIYLQHVE